MRACGIDHVRALYPHPMDGWNLGSGEAFAAPFAETHFKGTRLVGEVTDGRFLSNDIAVMHAIGGTVLPKDSSGAPPTRDKEGHYEEPDCPTRYQRSCGCARDQCYLNGH